MKPTLTFLTALLFVSLAFPGFAAAQDLSTQAARTARAGAIVPLDGPVLAGKPVTFKLSGNPSDPHWKMGDGATAGGSSVTHTYQKPGIYRVVMGSKVGDTFNELSSAIVRVHTPETLHLPQVFLDTDARNEVDDQHYIAYGLFSNVDVLGIKSIHHGPHRLDHGGHAQEDINYGEIHYILHLSRASGLLKHRPENRMPPVFHGARMPLQVPASGNWSDTQPVKSEGSEAILAAARGASPDNPVWILPVGPCTDIASAILLARAEGLELKSRIKICWLGGGPEQVHGKSFNGSNDPWSVYVTGQSGLEFWVILENPTNASITMDKRVESDLYPKNPLGTYLEAITPARKKALFDLTTISMVIGKHLGKPWLTLVEPSVVLGPDRGYRWQKVESSTNVYIVREIDAEAMKVDFFNTLNGKPTALPPKRQKRSGFAAAPAGPKWSRGLPIYQISPRFYSKDGSLASIKADLPRIKAMNVGIIYMMPIHPCTDNPDLNAQRKCNYYQSADYMAVNPVLGTMDDWKEFVQAVHDSGMYLILDYVPRHCSKQNPLVTERPEWFSGTSWGMPAFDFSRQDVRDYHLSVMKFWVKETGVDGFRIDVAGTIPQHVFKEYRPVMDTWKDIFIVAEAQGPIHHPQYDMTYDWRLLELMVKGLANGSRPASDIDALIHDDITSYPKGALRLRHTDNHDFNIGLTQFGKVKASLERRYNGGQKAFATLSATLPGKFMFFNGNEINNTKVVPHGGTTGWIDWVENPEYTEFYTTLCHVHRHNPAVYEGGMQKIKTDRDARIFAFMRQKDENRVLVFLNLSDRQIDFTYDPDIGSGEFKELFTGKIETWPTQGNMSLDAWEYRVYIQGAPVAVLR